MGGKALAFAFVMSLPETIDEVIVERAALFTWDDKSMNHLFQYRSVVAPGGISLPRNTHTRAHTRPHVKSRASVSLRLSLSRRCHLRSCMYIIEQCG